MITITADNFITNAVALRASFKALTKRGRVSSQQLLDVVKQAAEFMTTQFPTCLDKVIKCADTLNLNLTSVGSPCSNKSFVDILTTFQLTVDEPADLYEMTKSYDLVEHDKFNIDLKQALKEPLFLHNNSQPYLISIYTHRPDQVNKGYACITIRILTPVKTEVN